MNDTVCRSVAIALFQVSQRSDNWGPSVFTSIWSMVPSPVTTSGYILLIRQSCLVHSRSSYLFVCRGEMSRSSLRHSFRSSCDLSGRGDGRLRLLEWAPLDHAQAWSATAPPSACLSRTWFYLCELASCVSNSLSLPLAFSSHVVGTQWTFVEWVNPVKSI